VLFAVRGLRDYWDLQADGQMELRPDVTFTWNSNGGTQAYLLKKKTPAGGKNDGAIEAVLNELLVQSPVNHRKDAPAREN
jgi:hypothetical protein